MKEKKERSEGGMGSWEGEKEQEEYKPKYEKSSPG